MLGDMQVCVVSLMMFVGKVRRKKIPIQTAYIDSINCYSTKQWMAQKIHKKISEKWTCFTGKQHSMGYASCACVCVSRWDWNTWPQPQHEAVSSMISLTIGLEVAKYMHIFWNLCELGGCSMIGWLDLTNDAYWPIFWFGYFDPKSSKTKASPNIDAKILSDEHSIGCLIRV